MKKFEVSLMTFSEHVRTKKAPWSERLMKNNIQERDEISQTSEIKKLESVYHLHYIIRLF